MYTSVYMIDNTVATTHPYSSIGAMADHIILVHVATKQGVVETLIKQAHLSFVFR